MNEITSNLRSALAILDAQASRIGDDLDGEARNLQALVGSRDLETQKQIALLSESLGELHESLRKIRIHLVDSYTYARKHSTDDVDEHNTETVERSESLSDEPDLHPADASKMRHDEPTTLSGILRSLLMANEPAQREQVKKTD